ncbi:MAG TPA: hypothetical protein PKC45_00970, partial [Gemmatales bacterium]|nr:hypothetical protein [Gemmatales bacterium]
MDVATAEPGRATHDCRGGLFCVVDLAVLGSLRSAEGTGLGLLAALAFGAVALAVLLRVQALRLRQRRISS